MELEASAKFLFSALFIILLTGKIFIFLMKQIPNMVHSFYKDGSTTKCKSCFVEDIRTRPPLMVENFKDLTEAIDLLGSRNPHYKFFFLGSSGLQTDKKGRIDIFPSVCLPESEDGGKTRVFTNTINNRVNELRVIVKNAANKFRPRFKLDGSKEIMMLLEYYGIAKTPYIQVTESLQSAASIALSSGNKSGFVHVLALPFPTGIDTVSEEEQMVLYRMSSMVPEEVIGLLHTQMYMVGPTVFTPGRSEINNLAGRLICCFELDNASDDFWTDEFRPLPEYWLPGKAKDEYHETLLALNLTDCIDSNEPIPL